MPSLKLVIPLCLALRAQLLSQPCVWGFEDDKAMYSSPIEAGQCQAPISAFSSTGFSWRELVCSTF